MIQTINLHDFRNAFQAAGRGEQFTYEGLGVLFDYLEQYEQDTGEQIELDVIVGATGYFDEINASVCQGLNRFQGFFF